MKAQNNHKVEVTPTATAKYFYNIGFTIFFGDEGENESYVKNMGIHPYKEVEAEVDRLNEEHGYVAPRDTDIII